MKKQKQILILMLSVLCILFIGAGIWVLFRNQNSSKTLVERYELAHYAGNETDEIGEEVYNEELFYLNDYPGYSIADTFAFDNTARDGYYYLFGTRGLLMETFRSKDLADWEPMGFIVDDLQRESEESRAMVERIWAPEMVYDEDLGKYLLFFSASPDLELQKYTAGKGIVDAKSTQYLMYVMESDSPTGPFHMLNFSDASSVGAENVHHYNTTAGIKTTADDPLAIEDNGEYYKVAYPQWWAKYMFFNPETLLENIMTKIPDAEKYAEDFKTIRSGMAITIDPHHFVDDNGDKYLYFVPSKWGGSLCVVKMENWLKPDWDTFTIVTRTNFYTVEDAVKALAGKKVEKVPYEEESVSINEGPSVLKHNEKYYLTFSVNTYRYQSYSVVQAVADSPLGPFRKLTEEEGGVLLSADYGTNVYASGTGHHSMIQRDGKLYIVYHKHYSVELASSYRTVAMDEVKWVNIKDINGEELDVMYSNGPTVTAQPLPEFASEYKNVAGEAKISITENSLEKGSSLSYLTDGLLSIYRSINQGFIEKYVKETRITEDATIQMDFDTPKTIRSVMLYNSKNNENVFLNVKDIELQATDGTLYYMDDIKCMGIEVADYGDIQEYVSKPGAAAYAEFEDIEVERIRISVELPKGIDTVGLSEIRVLGK